MTTNLLGRRVRGQTTIANVHYDAERGPQPGNPRWVNVSMEGSVVAVTSNQLGDSLYLWIVTADHRLCAIGWSSTVVIPHDMPEVGLR